MAAVNSTIYAFYEDLAALGWIQSERHTLRLESQGRFPRRVALSERCKPWLRAEIVAFVAERIAARERATAPPVAA